MPTRTKENYLKALFSISQKEKEITITQLAEKLEVSKPTVNSMVKKMEDRGWLVYEKYKPLTLTSQGQVLASQIVRKHRLAEMFLSKVMNFGWEEVHDIAEELEHLNSEKFFDRMDEILGFPVTDPHGSPIPDKEGRMDRPNYKKLSDLKPGDQVVLKGLTNSSKELLIFLNKRNMELGTDLEVLQVEPFDQSMEIKISNGSNILLTSQVCQCLLVI